MMRRSIDFTFAALGLIVLSPLFGLIALAVKLTDGGPVFYGHSRVGRNFRRFRVLKFRSMVARADQLGGPVTAAGDQRVTRIGRFLRRSKLDELPQLINVLKGEMQLVGPRPECERYVRLFRAEYAVLLRDRPGITDPASVLYRDEEQMFDSCGDVEQQYISRILPGKLALSLRYAEHRTILSDLGIVLATVLGIERQGVGVRSREQARIQESLARVKAAFRLPEGGARY